MDMYIKLYTISIPSHNHPFFITKKQLLDGVGGICLSLRVLRGLRKGCGGVCGGRAYQNYYYWMNQKFSKYSFFNLPSLDQLPDLNHSLKLINTINAFPQHSSFENMDLAVVGTGTGDPVPEGGEDSLGQRISHVPTASHSAKKKRAGCTCKKTFCLKMYCECFSSGRDCGEGCECRSCKNTQEVRQQELSKYKSGGKEVGLRNCSLAEKRCNCKKSGCQKRYCECYNSGLTCSQACGCEGCKNTDAPLSKLPSFQQTDPKAAEQLQQFPSLKKCGSLDDLQQYYD